MNKFWLKIMVVVILTVTVIAGVYLLRPDDKKPATEPEGVTTLQKQKELASKTESSLPRPYVEESQAQEFHSKTPQWSSEKSRTGFSDSGQGNYAADGSRTQKSVRELPKGRYYSVSPGVVAAEELQKSREQLNDIGPSKTGYAQYVERLKSRQPAMRDRPDFPEDSEPVAITEEQMQQMNDDLLMKLLEEHKDNPEQAEQIKKILFERLEYYHRQRVAAKADSNDK